MMMFSVFYVMIQKLVEGRESVDLMGEVKKTHQALQLILYTNISTVNIQYNVCHRS